MNFTRIVQRHHVYLWYTFEAIHWVSLPCFVSILSDFLSLSPSLFFSCLKPPLLAPNYNNYNNSDFFDDDWQLRKGGIKPPKMNSHHTQIIEVIQFLVRDWGHAPSRRKQFQAIGQFWGVIIRDLNQNTHAKV